MGRAAFEQCTEQRIDGIQLADVQWSGSAADDAVDCAAR